MASGSGDLQVFALCFIISMILLGWIPFLGIPLGAIVGIILGFVVMAKLH